MSKRAAKMTTEVSANKKKKHWSMGLVESMKDPASIVKQTKNVVVIKDKYPKAKLHYLVLPQVEISSIYKLNESHVNLLKEFVKIYEEIKAEQKELKLKAGFHAIPSMQRLHMHIISNDMISPCLKTKIHWNSFTTSFFLPYKDVLQELKETGSINKLSEKDHKSLMATPLKCNQCSYVPANMPKLKDHLLSHSI